MYVKLLARDRCSIKVLSLSFCPPSPAPGNQERVGPYSHLRPSSRRRRRTPPPCFPTPPTPHPPQALTAECGWGGWVCQRLSPLPLSQKRHLLQWVGHQGSSETAELQPLLTLTTLCKRKPEAVKGKGVEGWGTRLGLEAFTQRMSYCPQGKGHHLCG